MPNWAYNNEIIYGPKAEIDGLYKKLINWTSINQEENGFGLKWIGNIVIGAGFKVPDGVDPCKSFSDLDNLQCKGSILNDFEVTDCDNGFAKISFDSETAWSDFRETWDLILEKHAPNCKYYFLSVEAGMDLFYKRDCDEHEFFPVDSHLNLQSNLVITRMKIYFISFKIS